MAEVIKKLKKNSSEEIWIAVTNYKDRELLDIRVYYRSIDDMEMKPTKRGVSLPVTKTPDLLAALEKINLMTKLDEPVTKLEKSDTETVFVTLKEFKGHKLVDIRIYFRPQTTTDLVPSQKGVAFKFGVLEDLKEGLRRVQVPSEGQSAPS